MNTFLKICKSIVGAIESFWYSLMLGFKSANDEIISQDISSGNIGIIQNKNTINLGEALRRGEVTKQVEELRYQDYRIYNESKNYKYIGDGQAIRVKSKVNREKFTFIQENEPICEGVLDSLNHIGIDAPERHKFDIGYVGIPRFKLESFCNYGKFIIDGKHINIELYFDKNIKSQYNRVTYGILNELDKISKFDSNYQIQNCDLCTYPQSLSFLTYKAINEEDFVQYFILDLNYVMTKETNESYVMVFESNNFERKSLTDKFYSSSMEEKYKNKEAKTRTFNLINQERIEYCDVCGKVIENVYDADITKETYGKRMCMECLLKVMNEQA